ncbi:DUF4214 domain-containing protein [Pigmentiphaga aceris]|uniref:DUF4214 domain-containing protein n=1 Tax=Pigmentiphaga aceris TaxID=1940612 RepID=A0A5C0AW85_9BURK|nr:DUF4214 domain-containing protein [Pigmentiphaga aceris]QEI04961.1 DUF4214 domain-containing protein [Pigmentiphaga aceris]
MDESITTHQHTVAWLYAALLDRAPDAGGMQFWAAAMANGASLTDITAGILGGAEARSVYPPGQSAVDFVSTLYRILFDREPDPSGVAFWANALAAQGAPGAAANAWLVKQILDISSQPLGPRPDGMSEADYARTLADRAVLANKAEAGVYFATVLGSDDIALAKQMLAKVTADPASVQAAIDIATGTPSPEQPQPPLLPAAPIITSPALTKDANPVLSGESAAGTTVKVIVGGATYLVAAADGTWHLDLTTAVPTEGTLALNANGDNVVSAVAMGAGGESTATTQTLVIDTTLPQAPVITSAAVTHIEAPVITGTAEIGDAVIVSVGGATYELVAVDGTWEVDLATASPISGTLALDNHGANPVSVIAIDAAGNVSLPGTQLLDIDPNHAPQPSITRADSVADIQQKFADYAGTIALVDAAGLSSEQWSAVAAAIGKVGSGNITGAMVLASDVASGDALALLAKYSGSAATLDASVHSLAVVQTLAADARVATLTDLSFALADAAPGSLASLVTKAPDAVIDVTAASTGALNSLADLITSPGSLALTGTLALAAAVPVDAMESLLSRYTGQDIHIVGTDTSAAQQALVNSHLDRVADGSISGSWSLTAEAVDAGADVFFAKLDPAVALSILFGDLSAAQRESLGLHLRTHTVPAATTLVSAAPVVASALSADALDGWLKTGSLAVDATDLSTDGWRVLVDRIDSIPAAGLSGAISIPTGFSTDAILALLDRYSGTSAQVDVAGMAAADLALLQPVLGKLSGSGLLNLSLDLGNALMTDSLSSALFARASGVHADATSATIDELRMLGNSPERLVDGGITGTVTVNKDLNLNQQLNLLRAKLSGDAQIAAEVTNLDVSALRALVLRADQLVGGVMTGGMHLNSQLTASEIKVLIDHFGGTFISAHATGMSAATIADMAASFEKFFGITGTLTMPGTVPIEQVVGLLSTYTDANATIASPTYAIADLDQLASNAKVSSLSAPLVNIVSVDGNTSAQLGRILAKSQSAKLDNASGDSTILPVLLANLGTIATGGITNWGASDRIALDHDTLLPASFTTFVGKLATDIKFSVNAAQMDADQVVALFQQSGKVAALSNLSVPEGAFARMHDDVAPLFMLQTGIHADLTGARNAQLNKVSQFIFHLADNGLTGTFTLTESLDATALDRLLSKSAVAANVTVDTTRMDSAQVNAVLAHLDKADTIISLSVTADSPLLADPDVLASLLSGGSNIAVDLQGASQAVIDVVLNNLQSVADGGLQHANLTMSAATWQGLDAAQLSAKLSIDAVVRVQGSAANETLDFTQMTRPFTVNAGAGADTIRLGGGVSTVVLGGRSDTKAVDFNSNTAPPTGIDSLLGVHNGVKMQLSQEVGAYINGVALQAGAVVKPAWSSMTVSAGTTFADIYALATSVNGLTPASTASEVIVRGIQYTQGGVGHAIIFVNDGVAGIDENDFFVHVVGGGLMQLTM